jgi:aspartate/methionine/tyrosine aminotransferase
VIFSRRTPADLSANPLARAVAARTKAYLDLTVSNPTVTGLSPSEDELHEALAPVGAATYRPDPKGLLSAREAVSRHYAGRGFAISPEQIVLTASTSEAYAHLFKLIGNAGDALLVPEPSYPLFDHLVRLEALAEIPYALRFSPADARWRIDIPSIERGLDAGARAVLSVHPNNPTGNFVTAEERRRLAALLDPSRHALISDEVFFDFPVEDAPDRAGVAASASIGPLAFSLGGLSKSCGLPQMKLAWIAVGGEPALVRAALDRLELIADTYLSVGTPVQMALSRLFELGAAAAERIRTRLRRNLAALDRALARIGGVRHPVEGGWSAIVRLPAPPASGDLAEFLLETAGILVQPGWFFNLTGEDVVVSLIPDPALFDEAVDRLVSAVA